MKIALRSTQRSFLSLVIKLGEVATVSLAITSCDFRDADTIPIHGVDITMSNPFIISPSRGVCKYKKYENQSPSSLEYTSFVRRIDKSNGLVVWPANVKCVGKYYSQNEAEYWSKKHDPIGTYIYLYKKYKHIRGVCSNITIISNQLYTAGRFNSGVVVNKYYVKRAPELFYIARNLNFICTRVGDYVDNQESIRHGYDPSALTGAVE